MPTVFAPALPLAKAALNDVIALAHEASDGPCLLLDTAVIRNKARLFREHLPSVEPHFAYKANPHREVVKTLQEEGVFLKSPRWASWKSCWRLAKMPPIFSLATPSKLLERLKLHARQALSGLPLIA